jgi:hypothetical protein
LFKVNKRIRSKNRRGFFLNRDDLHVRVDFYYVDSDSPKLKKLLKRVLTESDVISYNGHSNDGHYFDLDKIFGKKVGKKSRLPEKYQILFMNSCTSYTYFHKNLFIEKGGDSKSEGHLNFDLLLNGIGANFLVETPKDAENYRKLPSPEIILLSNLIGYETSGVARDPLEFKSWQTILDEMQERVGFDDSALTVLLGDTDNPNTVEEAIGYEGD